MYVILGLGLGLGLIFVVSATASAQVEENGAGAGAGIVNGTPVAVVVRGASSDMGSYRSSTARSGPSWTCGYHPLGVDTDTVLPTVRRERVDPEPGTPYGFLCFDEDGRLVHQRYLLYEPGDPFSGLLAAERAAELALRSLALPQSVVRHNPPADQVVGLPTWLWVDGSWETHSASAALGSVVSTVSAMPLSVTWDLGDGTRTVCAGPGTPYDPRRPTADQSTDCRATYTWSSRSEPSGAYELRATVRYGVSWSASTGEQGDLGELTRDSSIPIVVREIQALIR
jgi:hypothetical protein